jgi:hypothetical protein
MHVKAGKGQKFASAVIDKYKDGKWRSSSKPKQALKAYRQALLANSLKKR